MDCLLALLPDVLGILFKAELTKKMSRQMRYGIYSFVCEDTGVKNFFPLRLSIELNDVLSKSISLKFSKRRDIFVIYMLDISKFEF